jgi:DNA repair exonuclease SbcCD nuclease subunit
MTKFIFISDTHLGANPMGYEQQKGYPDKINEIITTLSEYINKRQDIDFILHGGDMIDYTTKENIFAAADVFNLPVPVYLCLGNHDLTTSEALDQWLKYAPQFFKNGKPDYTIDTLDCSIHISPNQWEEKPYYWSVKQSPHLLKYQKEFLSKDLNNKTDIPHILLTHSPVFGLPPGQTGLLESYHNPEENFSNEIKSISQKYPNLKCILGGHSHVNTCVDYENKMFITASSFVETPFEFKLFEVGKNNINMSTIGLSNEIPFNSEYNYDKTFVQGRNIDRQFTLTI